MTDQTTALSAAREILDTMLGYLGIFVTIHEEQDERGPGLQIESEDNALLIGNKGDRLDDIQYLVNRILQEKMPDAPRIRIDAGHFREQRESEMVEKIRVVAKRVMDGGRPVILNPLNSYHRRIVYGALKEFPEVEATSPQDRTRMKRITIRMKQG